MGRLWMVLALSVAAGCSSKDAPEDPWQAAGDLAGLPKIGAAEMSAKVGAARQRRLLVAFWRAEMQGTDAAAFLEEVNALAKAHGQAGLEVVAVNIDPPKVARDKALPILGRIDPKFESRWTDDQEGVGCMVDASWGGQTPALFLLGTDDKGRGRQLLHRQCGQGAAVSKIRAKLLARD